MRSEKKEKIAKAQFTSDLWNKDAALATRRYRSYNEYLRHQSSKLRRIFKRLKNRESEDLESFLVGFRDCAALQGRRNVLCLGARLGTEVKALRQLGYFAVGIDLNPGPDNRYVHCGDFQALDFSDGSVDVVYTNALDHVFDLGVVLAEIRRVLRPDGVFLTDLYPGHGEGFTPGRFEATHWRHTDDIISKIAEMGRMRLLDRRRLTHWAGPALTQAAFTLDR
jgi:SAM-dependent methyltransferase